MWERPPRPVTGIAISLKVKGHMEDWRINEKKILRYFKEIYCEEVN
jgi:hypothetical protein